MKKRKYKNYLGRNFKKVKTDDKLTTESRSLLMSKIKSKGTDFENKFILNLRALTRQKFETNVRGISGTPDVVFRSQKICIFLDSDFWHGWQYPRWKHLLKNDFWTSKIENNRKRDQRNSRRLRREGWTVVRIWEHQLKQKGFDHARYMISKTKELQLVMQRESMPISS